MPNAKSEISAFDCFESLLKQFPKLNFCPIPNRDFHLHFLRKSKCNRGWYKQLAQNIALLWHWPLLQRIALSYPGSEMQDDPRQI
jgi:hypothetical protein